MLRHVLDRCALARGVQVVVLCTDEPELADLAVQWGHEVVLREEPRVSGTDRLARALPTLLERFGGSGGIDQQWVVNVQADQPFLDPGLLERLRTALLNLGAESSLLTPVFRLLPHQIHDPAVVNVLLTADQGRPSPFRALRCPMCMAWILCFGIRSRPTGGLSVCMHFGHCAQPMAVIAGVSPGAAGGFGTVALDRGRVLDCNVGGRWRFPCR